MRRRPTHFVSIPLSNTRNKEAFLTFKANLLKKYGNSETNITVNSFIDENKLHYTLFVLTLESEAEIKAASKCLKTLLAEYECFQLKSNRLSCFPSEDKSFKARTLYVAPEKKSIYEDNLFKLVTLLVNGFYENKFLSDSEYKYSKPIPESLWFHSTLVNTKYAYRRSMDVRKQDKQKKSFLNLTEVLKDKEIKLEYPEMTVDKIHLSSMKKPVGVDKFYHSETIVQLKQ